MELNIEKSEHITRDTKVWILSFATSLATSMIAVAFREQLSQVLEDISRRKVVDENE